MSLIFFSDKMLPRIELLSMLNALFSVAASLAARFSISFYSKLKLAFCMFFTFLCKHHPMSFLNGKAKA